MKTKLEIILFSGLEPDEEMKQDIKTLFMELAYEFVDEPTKLLEEINRL